jgi:DNA-binding response OmpR family regulator
MPRLSGREACRRIRQINPTALVLLSSGYSREQVETETCEAAGFISKPYRPADLVAAVRAALNRTIKPSPP